MRYTYPATLETEADGRVTAYFDGLPGATWGTSRAEALEHAKDLLITAVEMLKESGTPLPSPPPLDGRPAIEADIS